MGIVDLLGVSSVGLACAFHFAGFNISVFVGVFGPCGRGFPVGVSLGLGREKAQSLFAGIPGISPVGWAGAPPLPLVGSAEG